MPSLRRPGRFSAAWLVFLASLAVLAGLVALLAVEGTSWLSPRPGARPLIVFCAAGLRKPVEAAAARYRREQGVEVQLNYGGSDALLNQIAVTGRGDLYLAADDSYVVSGRERGLLDEAVPLGDMRPVLAVKKGNPKNIVSLDDLLTRKLRVAHANPEAAAVGKIAREALKAAGRWTAFEQCVVVTKPTVTDVANDVALGAVDAGVVWDATVRQFGTLETVPAAPLAGASATFAACVVRSTEQPAEALRFARFLAAADQGGELFEEHGFNPVRGDAWELVPRLTLFAGAMLRPALEETLTAFEQREGVELTRVYNGCGILVAQMKAKQGAPDAYFACDQEFLTQVHDLFGPATTVSGNQLVILVHKGNPHDVRRLKDLAKPGLRVGIGHEKQCAMGVLTQQTLKEDRSSAGVMKNVKVQSPTGDMLVNQMRTRSLDAAVAYISNAAGSAEFLDAVPIDIPCAFAEQPFAVARGSERKQLAGRLLEAVLRHESRERFEAYGFGWKAGAKR